MCLCVVFDEVWICGAADEVVAVAGAGCPVMAAMVAPALAEPDCLDFFLPFFFSYFMLVSSPLHDDWYCFLPLANPKEV